MFDRVDEITVGLLLKPVIIGFAISILFSLILSVGSPWSQFFKRFANNLWRFAGYALPVVLLGYISGYLTGISRTAAVASVIPAVLTFVGGLSIYLFGYKSGANVIAAGYSVFLFGFSIFYGIQVGAFEREYEQTDRYIILSNQEKTIRTYRQNLGLPTDPPDWITGAAKN